MVARMLPETTLGHLLQLGDRRRGDALPDVGLENGR